MIAVLAKLIKYLVYSLRVFCGEEWETELKDLVAAFRTL